MSESLFESTDVIELSDKDFGTGGRLKKGGPGIIMFYASYCPHCQSKQQSYMALGKQLNKKNGGYKVYSVSTTDPNSIEIVKKMQIAGVPTFMEADKLGKLSLLEGPYDPDMIRERAKQISSSQMGGGGYHVCKAYKNDGTRCTRAINQVGGFYCWQHN